MEIVQAGGRLRKTDHKLHKYHNIIEVPKTVEQMYIKATGLPGCVSLSKSR